MAYVLSLDTKIKAQVCYMQALLNDEFDFLERRIIIRDVQLNTDELLLWQEGENKPQMICCESSLDYRPYVLNRDYQIRADIIDFEIVFPTTLSLTYSETRRLQSLVNQNKLASKRYRIIYE